MIQSKLTVSDDQLIPYAVAYTPPEELPPIQRLWRGMDIPSLQDILSNPAICPSRFSKFIFRDNFGKMKEFWQFPDGALYDPETDLIEWTVTGRGKLKHDPSFMSKITTCDDEREHYTKGTFRHCNRPTCPACANYHIQNDSEKAAKKILAAAKHIRHTAPEGEGWKLGHLQHITVSPPPELYWQLLTPEGVRELNKKADQVVQLAGLIGGGRIFHPFRQDGIDDDADLSEDYTPSPTNSMDKHKGRFSPHYHYLGFGFITNTQEIYKKTGWVVKSIRTGQKSIKNLPEVEGIIKYLLSHAGVVSDDSPFQPSKAFQRIVWIGLCNSRRLPLVGTIRIHNPQLCPQCGAPLIKYTVHGCNGDVSRDGEHFKRDEYPIYSEASSKARLRAYIEDNKGDLYGILQGLDRNPQWGVSCLAAKQFSRMIRPDSFKALDGSIHPIEPYATIRLQKSRSRRTVPTPKAFEDSDRDSQCTTKRIEGDDSSIVSLSFNPPDTWIDYHLPPEVDV